MFASNAVSTLSRSTEVMQSDVRISQLQLQVYFSWTRSSGSDRISEGLDPAHFDDSLRRHLMDCTIVNVELEFGIKAGWGVWEMENDKSISTSRSLRP